MGTAGAEGGSSLDDLLGKREARAAAFVEAGDFRGQSAAAQLRPNFFDGFDERDNFLREDGVIEAASIGDAFFAVGETLATKPRRNVGSHAMRQRMERRVANIL